MNSLFSAFTYNTHTAPVPVASFSSASDANNFSGPPVMTDAIVATYWSPWDLFPTDKEIFKVIDVPSPATQLTKDGFVGGPSSDLTSWYVPLGTTYSNLPFRLLIDPGAGNVSLRRFTEWFPLQLSICLYERQLFANYLLWPEACGISATTLSA